jgi:transcriptional regulator with XRE-family HTH domain
MSVVADISNHYALIVSKQDEKQIFTELGKRIVSARKQKNMSQESLAAESGVDRSHIGFIEQGRRRPTIPTLHRIAKSLNLTLEDLFKGL